LKILDEDHSYCKNNILEHFNTKKIWKSILLLEIDDAFMLMHVAIWMTKINSKHQHVC
jgi:hypothetical protein